VNSVTSQDGTAIVYDRLGEGPPVVLVTGGSVDRRTNAPLAAELAGEFSVYNYERRGRGESGDTPPYAVEREVEDLSAVIDAAGGSSHLYGTSSGAALAMKAGAAGLPITKLALWEPPYSLPDRPKPPADTAKVFRELMQQNRRDDAVEFFMAKVVGLPPEFVQAAREAPFWRDQVEIAHTLEYDATIMGDYNIPEDVAKAIEVPTIVIDGEASFDSMAETSSELARLIPNARRATLPGQSHDVDPTVIAPVLAEFFRS
jgi:pimeloyl-ACP methyl ester carboxylesterase